MTVKPNEDTPESTKDLEAELLGETKEGKQESGGSSPVSPAFEVENSVAPPPVDPKAVLSELGMCIYA